MISIDRIPFIGRNFVILRERDAPDGLRTLMVRIIALWNLGLVIWLNLMNDEFNGIQIDGISMVDRGLTFQEADQVQTFEAWPVVWFTLGPISTMVKRACPLRSWYRAAIRGRHPYPVAGARSSDS